MTTISSEKDIWSVKPSKEARRIAADYASRTLPWTFNRMMMNTSPRGQIDRALNIAKGIVGQEALRERLRDEGIAAATQKKSHRADDLFDFTLKTDGTTKKYDVKTISYYSDYANDQRPKFTPKLVFENRGYSGPDWRKFFPCLMAHTQIGQDKEAYIFAITESPDFRRTLDGRSEDFIAAFPYGPVIPFFSSPKLCAERERAGKGFTVALRLEAGGLFDGGGLAIDVLYEFNAKNVTETVKLEPKAKPVLVGPISVFNCVRISRQGHARLNGTIRIAVAKNELSAYVPNSQMVNINVAPTDVLMFGRDEFCNLILPDDFTVHFLGWTAKTEFLRCIRKYPAWVWPIDANNRYENSPWLQVTEADRNLLTRLGLQDCIGRNPTRINVGLMKTTGKGNGACCYVFPNTFRGGLRETNFYVLPQDLYPMSTLGKR